MGKKTQRKLHHITRLDYVYGAKKSHGWWVRIQRLVDGKRKAFGKSFHDGKYGGKAKALAAAVKWRDEILPKYPVVRNGSGSGRLHAPVGHAIFWEYKSGRTHSLNVNMKTAEHERPIQFRCSIKTYGRQGAIARMRRWYLEMRRQLREAGTLASDATLKAYFERLKDSRPKARRTPWDS
ncbi:MAG: hypothetical protein JXP37_01675 [Coriobacteriia bacterium]|nr:hypothetical protein [Coriobacteriia bacterium]